MQKEILPLEVRVKSFSEGVKKYQTDLLNSNLYSKKEAEAIERALRMVHRLLNVWCKDIVTD